MQLWLDDHQIAKEISGLSDFQSIWSGLEKELFQNRKLIYFVEIDGQTFYSGYESIIVENVDRIHEIKVFSITFKSAILQSLSDMAAYIDRLIASMPKMTNPFYAEPTSEAWSLFQQFCEGIDWLIHTAQLCKTLSETEREHLETVTNLHSFIKRFPDMLRTMDAAIQDQDYILLADTLQYEFGSLLEDISIFLKESGVISA